jgi:SAM-dependent methyltransferase
MDRSGGRETVGADLARYYDLDLLGEDDDVDLYLALARRQEGLILELAVGSGRIALPLARSGHRVVGVDHDPAMLARARVAWEREGRHPWSGSLELVEADLTEVRLADRFALVILGLNSLLLLPGRAARAAALSTMAAHLAPGGRAVVDVAVPSLEELAGYDGRLQLEWIRHDPERDEMVTKMVSARYEPSTACLRLTQLFDAHAVGGGAVRRIARDDELSLLSVDQLVAELADAGMAPVELGGDHLLTPLGPGSSRVVVVARSL